MTEGKEGSGTAPVMAEMLPELKLRKTVDDHGKSWIMWNYYDIEQHGPKGADDLSSYLGVTSDGKVYVFKWISKKNDFRQIRIQ